MMKPTREYRIEHINSLKEQEPDRTKHLHVTDLSACPVGVWLQKTDQAKAELNESVLRRFDAGHAIEERVIEAYKHAKVLVISQVPVMWNEYNMVGSADAIIKEGNQHWLIEIKSIHTFAIDHLYKEDKVHAHYEQQVMLYWSKLKEIYPDLKARIYYEALDGRTFEKEIQYDPEVVTKALDKAKGLHECIINNKKPEKSPEFLLEDDKWKLDWRTKYCIDSGIHYKCDENPLSSDSKSWINKLTYKAKKLNQQKE